MIPFRKVLTTDKPTIDTYLSAAAIPICDYTFANIYCWQHQYNTVWAEVDSSLVVRFDLGHGQRGYMVLGCENFGQLLPLLMEDAHDAGLPFRMIAMCHRCAESFAAWADAHYGLRPDGTPVIINTEAEAATCLRRGNECFAICDNRDYQDYIYSLSDLCQLTGRKYQPKRNHVNRFETLYDYTFEELRVEDIDECLRLEDEWQQRKEADEVDDVEHRTEHEYEMSEEQRAIRRAFDAYEALGLYGGVLRVEGRMVAFTYGSQITPEVFCTHIEKADSSYEGVFPMINRCFARALAARGYTMVNREEDMGLAGLRRSKMSYHPAAMQEKMTLRALSLREIECRELWQRVFGDDRAFIDLYLTEVYRPENMLVRCDEAGHIVSMLHIVEIETIYGPTGYLYAIATDEAWRGRGLASALIEEAVEELRRRGMAAVMLIPSHEDLKAFYERLGFEESNYPLDFSEGFDFGTGDAQYDLAMVRPLK